MTTKHYIECDCGHPDHLMTLTNDSYCDIAEGLNVSFRLKHHGSFWRRVWVAIKYVCKVNDLHQFDGNILFGWEIRPKGLTESSDELIDDSLKGYLK